jgi:signal peptidase I
VSTEPTASALSDEEVVALLAQRVPTKLRRWSRIRSDDSSALLHAHTPLPWMLRIIFTIITLSVLLSFAWSAAGGSLYSVSTTSMCPKLCVGALTLDRPLVGAVKVGEVVTFTPPGLPAAYTHRVVKVLADGSFISRGDAANINDPWVVAPSDVHGVVVGQIWGLGWLSLASRFLALGMVAILFLRRSIPVLIRREYDRLFALLVVLVPIWLMKPLLRGIVVSSVPTNVPGVARVAIVNTGLLPAQFRATQGQFRDFVSSGHRVVMTGRLQSDGQVHIQQLASFHFWGWAVVYVVVLLPMISYVARQYRLRRLGLRTAKLEAVAVIPDDIAASQDVDLPAST